MILSPYVSAFNLKITTLNVRGFGSSAKRDIIFDFSRTAKSEFVCLQETLAATKESIKSLQAQWSGQSFWAPALGKQGGVAILVPENSRSEVLNWQKESTGQIISLLFKIGELRFNLINFYAPTNPSERKGFFDTLHEYFYPNAFRIIAGDFNCYESENDKFGGNFNPFVDLKEFRTTHRLFDAWRFKHRGQRQCTWFNADKSIGSRLDKFFISSELSPSIVNCEILPCFFSDHDMVHLTLKLDSVHSLGNGVWKLNQDLLKDSEFCYSVSALINSHVLYQEAFPTVHEWWDFLKSSIKTFAIEFSREKQRKLNYDKVCLVNQLIDAKHTLLNGDSSARKTIHELKTSLKAISLLQQKSNQIRSRAKWIEEGEKPSRFFLKLQQSRIQKNYVSSIFNVAGDEVTSQAEIECAHFDFYRELYSKEDVNETVQDDLISKVNTSLMDEEFISCVGPLTSNEISAALQGLSNDKTPGPDGLPLEFYAKFWSLLSPVLVDVYNFSLDQGMFTQSMQQSVTRLIHKKDDKRNLRNWRPISVLNVDYKICSKALANRLSKVFPSIVHRDQTCSVPGRTIFDNLALLRDVLDYVNITNETGILLSLDQEKAFDRLDRTFLMNTLRRFGFGPSFQRWIRALYFNASMKIIVNGFLTESIPLERGVRQGNPLSPLLYVICAEVLSSNIRSDNSIEGFLLPGSSGQCFKMRQYADDSTCFLKSLYSLDCLFILLSKYEVGTGAKLNVSKCEAMWLGAWKTCPLTPHGIQWVNKMKVLGVWFGNGTIAVTPENWLPRLSKLENNLDLWKTRSLSMTGKITVINILGASKFWFLGKVLLTPEWVV